MGALFGPRTKHDVNLSNHFQCLAIFFDVLLTRKDTGPNTAGTLAQASDASVGLGLGLSKNALCHYDYIIGLDFARTMDILKLLEAQVAPGP